MASFTIEQYVASLIPDMDTLIPGYSPAAPINGAMALYWSYLFPKYPMTYQSIPLPDDPADPSNPVDPLYMNQAVLTERQKWMIGLRVALSLQTVLNKWLTSPQILEAAAMPALTKFQDLSKVLKAVLPLWQTDLTNAEAAEGIFFNLLPSTPAYLLRLESNWIPVLGETIGWMGTYVIQSHAFFEGDDPYE